MIVMVVVAIVVVGAPSRASLHRGGENTELGVETLPINSDIRHHAFVEARPPPAELGVETLPSITSSWCCCSRKTTPQGFQTMW